MNKPKHTPLPFTGHRFCSRCDYAVTKEQYCPDCGCPNCGCESFYSFGSLVHYERYSQWLAGKLKGNPVPPPSL